jgi:TolB-like protein
LKVLGRSSMRDYRGRAPRDVARDLGAGVVLTGSLRPSGDAIKVSLELIDPGDGTAIWSNQYTREIKDVFAVQAQVAAEVAQGTAREELDEAYRREREIAKAALEGLP